MWKWIVGVMGVIILLVAGTCYIGLKKFTKGGGTAVIALKATPEHVFAMVSDPDSLAAWSEMFGRPAKLGTGMFAAGDTITTPGTMVAGSKSNEKERIEHWVVREVRPPMLIVMDALMTSDSTGAMKRFISRRDSVVVMGDSTMLYSSFTMPMFSDMRASQGDTSKAAPVTMGFLEKMVASGLRLMAESDFKKLKLRVEQK